MKYYKPAIVLFLVNLLLISTSNAELGGTLKKIKDSGAIVLAYRETSIPFSYVPNIPNQPVGYSHDLQLRVVEAVKEKLGLKDLTIRYNLVNSQTRIVMVANGTVDLECGSTTNNAERQKQVDFSLGFIQVSNKLLTAKDSGIKGITDLKGKVLVTTAGTTNERFIKNYNLQHNLGAKIITAKDHGDAFLMVESGRADAFMMDDPILYGEIAKSKQPQKWLVTNEPMSSEIYGCMLRKGDTEFKHLVDATLMSIYKSGEIYKLYTKWFESPIPPNGINLNFPMSEGTKQLFSNPHDREK